MGQATSDVNKVSTRFDFDRHRGMLGVYGAFHATKEAYQAGEISHEQALSRMEELLGELGVNEKQPPTWQEVLLRKNDEYVAKRKPLDFGTRYAALRKSGGRCPYCGVELEFEHEDGERIAVDHIIPFSRGGADHISNLIACCFACNDEKRTKTGLEYICEREGLEIHWYARLNPEWDGYSSEDDDPHDRAAWLACWPEVYDMDDESYAYEAEV